MTPSLSYYALMPELVLVGVFVVVLIADLVLGDARKQWLTSITGVGLVAALASVVILLIDGTTHVTAGGTYVSDHFALVFKAVAVVSTLAVVVFGSPKTWRGEYFLMILAALTGASLLASSRDLVTFFIAFELVAVPTYLLVAWDKASRYGHEAALRYFVVGVVTTTIMAYGLSFLFGLAGTTSFSSISVAVDTSNFAGLAYLAVGLVVTGIAFKLAAVPFHFWASDTYSAAPLPVVVFLSTLSKVAGLIALILMVGLVFPAADNALSVVLWVVAAVTMTIGNLVALRQKNVLRLFAWSSISQTGFLIVPLALVGPYGASIGEATSTAIQYFVVYAVATVAALAVIAIVLKGGGGANVSDLRGLFFRRPVLAVSLAVAVLSLAGVPPLGGWFTKYLILDVAIGAGTTMAYVIAAIAAVNTAISLVYYAIVVRQLWLTDNSAEEANVPVISEPIGLRFMVMGAPVLLVVAGILPSIISSVGGGSFLGQ